MIASYSDFIFDVGVKNVEENLRPWALLKLCLDPTFTLLRRVVVRRGRNMTCSDARIREDKEILLIDYSEKSLAVLSFFYNIMKAVGRP